MMGTVGALLLVGQLVAVLVGGLSITVTAWILVAVGEGLVGYAIWAYLRGDRSPPRQD